jgi:DNA-binding protein YbaB
VTDWLQIAKDSFEASTNYLDANLRKHIERNIALFQSKHPTGSKYNSAAFKSRSRLFRPKTKSVVRKNEAAASAAFFANVDVVTVEAENDGDPMQAASAALMNEILNYRLTKTIPWYMVLIGAVQEAQVIGIVGSYQYWKYKEKATKVRQIILDGLGNEIASEVVDGPPDVIEDKPCIELMPVENYRFDPAADWTDVVGSSPYFIRMVPMYVDDVRQRMAEEDPNTGQKKWKKLEDGEIRTAMVEYDTIRQAREAPKQDPKGENQAPMKEFEIVWCHENFVRLAGEEKVYWTLGTQHMLTDPVPLKEAYFHGIRPFTIGCAVIEAHKAIPESLVAIGSELQKEVNETVNQRRDNVSLVLNKRYKTRRNAQVDTEALLRNVPGGVILMNDPEKDVIEMITPDVTNSAYQEQDRLNVDFDELTGNFSQGSVQTNRKLNETVGGMQMMGSSANQMTEYLLRTIVETWVEKTLQQLVQLEQAYETDEVILGLAGDKAELMQKYGVDQITDSLLNKSLTVRVNIGMGATDPQQKLGKFLGALKAYGEAMQMIPDANPEAIRNEVFGLAGYKNGNRFFGENQANMQLQQQMQEMQKAMQEMSQEFAAAQLALQNKAGELEVKAFDAETKRIAATKQEAPEGPNDLDALQAVTDAALTDAQIDLTQAQTIKTLEEAKAVPSMALAKKATHAE